MKSSDKPAPLPAITVEYLEHAKAVLRGAMEALGHPLEKWERREFQQVRRDAIAEIRRRIAAVRPLRGGAFARLDK